MGGSQWPVLDTKTTYQSIHFIIIIPDFWSIFGLAPILYLDFPHLARELYWSPKARTKKCLLSMSMLMGTFDEKRDWIICLGRADEEVQADESDPGCFFCLVSI